MSVDNRQLIAPFVPEVFDGDTFLYTEILDRRKRSGNNRGRRLREFIHRDRAGFLEQAPRIIEMCDFFQARAYTRLSPRSFRLVGMAYVKTIVEQALTGNWQGMRHAYAKALGTTPPLERMWLFDCDTPEQLQAVYDWVPGNVQVATIPSRKGHHVITRPFDASGACGDALRFVGVQLHKDNPTNLYIPDEAA
jgi:hypothetical protein